MRKKINIIFDYFPSDTSGGLLTTYKRLISLLKDDYDFEIYSIFNCNKTALGESDHVRINNILKSKHFPSITSLRSNLKHFKILSIIKDAWAFLIYFFYIPICRSKIKSILQNDTINIVVSPATAMFCPKSLKFILEVHSSFDYFFGPKSSLLGRMQANLMREPTLVLFRTKSDALKAKRIFNSYYIYNFFSTSSYPNVDLDCIKKRDKKIIFMGRLAPEKNLLKMLQIAKKLKNQVPDFKLDIYGTGVMENELKEFIKNNDLTSNVELKGFCNNLKIYRNYSLLWITSDYEGFGLVIIEAKANGVPTISTNWGEGVFEVIDNEKNGFILETNEDFVTQTIKLWDNSGLLLQMSQNALKSFSKFNQVETRKKWLEILTKFEKNDYKFTL